MSIGTILYYLLWPAIWFYAPLRLRVSVIVICGDEILEVKNWFGPAKWQLPGGGLKQSESVLQCGARELREELSIDIPSEKLQQISNSILIAKQFGLLMRNHIVKAELRSKPEIKLSKELTQYRWVNKADSALPKAIKVLM